MRTPAIFFVASFFIVDLVSAQTTELPMYRPALVGNAPSALINRINTQELLKNGQKDGALMFCCMVGKNGDIGWSGTYRATANSQLLEQEVQKKLAPAAGVKFVPAIYHHQPADVLFYGTVVFKIADGKPRLRIFSNQETDELKNEADFISPQLLFGGESKFHGFRYPMQESRLPVTGGAAVLLRIDADGNLQQATLVSEEPPFLGFGEAALADFKDAKYTPAFRNGKPVACEVTLPAFFKPTQ
ncbi:MAG: Gram-negative bacterial TonB protein C-terminal [Verrucomicrobiota bacterium]|jgi:TonB family protein